MTRLIPRLLAFLGAATDKELAQQVQYLKAENRILRGKLPQRIAVTPQERRRLVKLGKLVGSAIKELVTIVSPRTFARWLSAEKTPPKKTSSNGPGRPKKHEEIRKLIIQLAEENAWGYTRILGELKKLGLSGVSRSTIASILKENGLDPAPKRGEGTWHEFIKRHASTLWACDFFTKKVWTLGGLVDIYVLFFIHIGTRRVHIAGVTANPDGAWMVQQARNISMIFADEPTLPEYLIMDMDTKFTAVFRETLATDGVETIRVGPRAPNLNAFAERWVLSIRSECLDHFVCFGESHLRHIVNEYVEHYYNTTRPHQGLDNRPIPEAAAESATIPFPTGEVVCEEHLGGLLKHYRRVA